MVERPSRRMVEAARALRGAATRSEALLWGRLRARRFEGLKFRRQHPLGPFVLDFCCSEARLAVEIDGGVHASRAVRAHDRERQRLIEEAGIRVVRVRAEDVEADMEAVLDRLRGALTPGPSPRSREARGGRI